VPRAHGLGIDAGERIDVSARVPRGQFVALGPCLDAAAPSPVGVGRTTAPRHENGAVDEKIVRFRAANSSVAFCGEHCDDIAPRFASVSVLHRQGAEASLRERKRAKNVWL
jgi:hypothetical protein